MLTTAIKLHNAATGESASVLIVDNSPNREFTRRMGLTYPGGWKYPNGRTIADAVATGDYYELRAAQVGPNDYAGDYSCPGCGSPEEAAWAAWQWMRFPDDAVVSVYLHLPGSRIGASILSYVGTVSIRDRPVFRPLGEE